jgi:tetratricopeptide (TPR) repeat protein
MLVELLKASGKTKEAKLVADEAAAEMPQRLSFIKTLLVAQCAEAEGDFAKAAKYYALGPWTSSPSDFATESPDKYTEKALECAIKAPNFDKQELSKLYLRVADRQTSKQQKDASDLYQKAIDLLPDSDPQKSSLMTRLANYNYYQRANSIQQSKQRKASPVTQSETVQKTPDESSSKDSTMSSEQVAKIQTHLNDLEKIATFSELNHHSCPRSAWAQLACAEITEGNWRKGVTHAQHVIALFSANDSHNHSDVLGDRSNITGCLVSKKHADEAEKLLLAAAARARLVSGEKNVETQAQLKDLFAFYVAQKDYAKAAPILDKVLDCDLTTGETLSQSLTHSHCGPSCPQSADAVEVLWAIFVALNAANKNNPLFVKESYEKILAAQRKALAPSDERLTPTLARLGDINSEMQKYETADGYYSQAFELAKQYHQGEFAVRQVGKHFIENLKKLGRDAEAKTLSDADWEGVRKK